MSPIPGRLETVLLVAAAVGLALGGLLYALGSPAAGRLAWGAVTAAVLLSSVVTAVRELRRRQGGVDLIAILAMAGALLLGELLAGAIIALMLTGGRALERHAVTRARRALTRLLEREPPRAHRRVGKDLVTVEVGEVGIGDLIFIKPGEVVPADGVLTSPAAMLDESALSGESRPVGLKAGAIVRSGGTNVGDGFELRVTAPAAQSTYAGIVRLVRAAAESKAPFVRLADQYALAFLGVTATLATGAWAASGDPVRALAVLVVATPCPLILAAPAAIIAGVSLAARHGILVKGGGPLETLARVSIILLDKTGTVTSGRPRVLSVESFGALSGDELLKLAASVEQLSLHPFAPAILSEASSRGLQLAFPLGGSERMGVGITARVDGHQVSVGQLEWVAPDGEAPPQLRSIQLRTMIEGSSSVFVSVDGQLAGALVLNDPIRAEAPRTLRALRQAGVRRVEMVTGDHRDVAELVGDAIGADRVFAERTPEEKVEVLEQLRGQGLTAMVGDGINDAPALALADVGVAMGARGATAASEAADVVLTVDRLERLLLAIRIAQRTRRIALQSVLAGMGLSLIAMGVAAAGYLPPVWGALLQEGIDVVVILNALRALRGGRLVAQPVAADRALATQLTGAHQHLRPELEQLSALAGKLEALTPPEARRQLQQLLELLNRDLLPHEREEQRSAYPLLARLMSPEDPTGPLIQTHNDIHRRVRLLSRMLGQLAAGGPDPDDLRELRRALYGLHAILSLHFAQEEDLFSVLDAQA